MAILDDIIPSPPFASLASFSNLLKGSPRDLLGAYIRYVMAGDLLGFFQHLARQHGDIVSLGTGPWPVFFVNHPDYIQHVLKNNHKNYCRSNFFEVLKPLLGQGLLTSDGQAWQRQRRLTQPGFHPADLSTFTTTITQTTMSMLDHWHDSAAAGRPLDIAQELKRLTLEIIGKTLFGVDLSDKADEILQAFTLLLEHMNYRSTSLVSLPESLPTLHNLHFQNAIHFLNSVVTEIVDQAAKQESESSNLLTLLLASRDRQEISPQQVRDEIMTFILGGYEATANALTWILYLLSQHPSAERQVRSEVTQVLGTTSLTVGDVSKLQYTQQVIQEVLRLYPPFWATSRKSIREDQIDRYHIPAQATIMLSPYVVHRHPEFWTDPDTFDPTRFASEATVGRHPYAYVPFGAGPRRCIGDHYAMMELQLIIPLVLQHFQLQLVPGHRVEPYPLFSLRMRYGMLMHLTPV